jgi:translocation-and-assembly-module (TAM) inner membrane subunit TamB-like protein
MNDNLTETKDLKPIKRSFLSRLGRFIVRAILFLLVFFFSISLIFTLLSQSEEFRSWLTGNILGIVNESLDGEILVDDLIINPFADIQIKGINIQSDGDTLAYIDRILIDVSYMDLLSERAYVNKIFIGDLKAKLIKKKGDSLWNFEKLVPPSEDTTESAGPPSWIIDLYNLQISNAEIIVSDYNEEYVRSDSVNFSHLHVDDFNISLSAYAKLDENRFSADILAMNLDELKSGFEIKNFSIEAEIDTLHAKASNLSMRTKESKFEIDAELKGVNFFGENADYELFHSPMEVKVEAEKFDMYEMKNIIPIPLFINANPSLSFQASGHLDSISIDKIDLQFKRTKINIDGSFTGLYGGNNLVYDVTFSDTRINDKDAQNVLPDLKLTSIPNFGTAIMDGTHVIGSTDSAFAELNVNTNIGVIVGEAGIRWNEEYLYSADVEVSSIKLADLARSPSLRSRLNAKVKIDGSEFDIQKMNTRIEVEGVNSKFTSYGFKKFDFALNIDSGIVNLEKLEVILATQHDTVDVDEFANDQTISMTAKLDLTDETHPKYAFDIKINAVDMNDLFDVHNAPEYIDCGLRGEFEGFELDSIRGKLFGNVGNCFLTDRSIMPFDLKMEIQRSGMKKNIDLKSDILDLSLNGEFEFDELLDFVVKETDLILEHVDKRLAILKQDNEERPKAKKLIREIENRQFKSRDIDIKATINDLSFVNPFLDDIQIDLKADIDLSFAVDSLSSFLNIDSINIANFDITSDSLNLSIENLFVDANVEVSINDSALVLNKVDCNVNRAENIILNDLSIKRPIARVSYDGENVAFELSGGYSDMVTFSSKGKIDFFDKYYKLGVERLSVGLDENIKWRNSDEVLVNFTPGEIEIEQFQLKRKDAESIGLSGKLLAESIDSIKFELNQFNLDEINKLPFVNRALPDIFPSGLIENLTISANGDYDNTEINFQMLGKDLLVNDEYLGNIYAKLDHLNSNITGEIEISNPKSKSKSKTLDLVVNAFPMDLSFNSSDRVSEKEEIDITLKAYKLPLEIVSPFAPAVSNLAGRANADLFIKGFLPDDIRYSGNVDILNATFLVDATNMIYHAKGKVDIEQDLITFEGVEVRNTAKDFRNGLAYVDGRMQLENFDLGEFEFSVTTDRLKVLSNATAKTMPQLYGTLVIATDTKPLRFFGTLAKPFLHGSVNIVDARLQMPEIKKTNVSKSAFIYEFVSKDTLKIVRVVDSTIQSNEIEKKAKRDLADLIDYKIDLKILKTIDVTMEMGTLGQLVSQMGTSNKDEVLHFEMQPGSTPKMYGTKLEVKSGSSLKFVYFFDTEGEIDFRSGSISNPGINLKAIYKGSTNTEGSSVPWEVIMNITGTKEYPQYVLTYTRNGVEATGDTAKVREDAIYLLMTGRTKSEMEMGGGGGSLYGTAYSAGSSLLSKMLTDAFQGTGVIQSADIDFTDADNFSNATIRITGRLMGDARWKVGGSMADFMQNNEITIEMPLDLGIEFWGINQTNIEFTRSINNAVQTNKDQKDWEFKFKFAGSD